MAKQNSSHDHPPLFKPNEFPTAPNLDISFSSYIRHKSGENDDLEISIFDAHKYFSDNNKELKPPPPADRRNSSHDLFPRISSVSSADNRHFPMRSTPTASSEASWNSQTGLLVNPPGTAGVSMRGFSDRKKQSIGWIFGRNCCCTGEKSVRIKRVTSNSDSAAESRSSSYARGEIINHQKPPVFPVVEIPRQQRVTATGPPFVEVISGGFSFPIMEKPRVADKSQPLRKPTVNLTADFPPRESIEVYQPWRSSVDATRRHYGMGSPIKRPTNSNADDDNGSDASSDLFEIESISTQTASFHMYRSRDSFEDTPRKLSGAGRSSIDDPSTPSVAATECYPPSEVSVDWSVTTAEGLASISNFSVSASQIGIGENFLRRRMEEEKAEAAEAEAGADRRRVNNNAGLLLLSCRHEKAVSVGPQPVKFPSGEGSSNFPVRIAGRPPRSEKSPPLGAAQSARLSLAFAA
ncbi:hypothetical protein M569_06003 [Genlisea aurea]|uniref:Phytochrome kinase substrate 1 n=1 Tax=Genlisea aurea TaxID=192259 RepID=S8CPU0_9LAMI|nr:hypothetical protein M569_06003 [Genlisea aurea]